MDKDIQVIKWSATHEEMTGLKDPWYDKFIYKFQADIEGFGGILNDTFVSMIPWRD